MQLYKIHKHILPIENVILCLSFLGFGLKVFIPFLWFPFEKCLMKVASTLSMSLVTCAGNKLKQKEKSVKIQKKKSTSE